MTEESKIMVNGIECPMCQEQIWSRYGHDFRRCKCQYCFVDGGRSYLRYGWGNEMIPQDKWVKPKDVQIDATDEINEYNAKYGKKK